MRPHAPLLHLLRSARFEWLAIAGCLLVTASGVIVWGRAEPTRHASSLLLPGQLAAVFGVIALLESRHANIALALARIVAVMALVGAATLGFVGGAVLGGAVWLFLVVAWSGLVFSRLPWSGNEPLVVARFAAWGALGCVPFALLTFVLDRSAAMVAARPNYFVGTAEYQPAESWSSVLALGGFICVALAGWRIAAREKRRRSEVVPRAQIA